VASSLIATSTSGQQHGQHQREVPRQAPGANVAQANVLGTPGCFYTGAVELQPLRLCRCRFMIRIVHRRRPRHGARRTAPVLQPTRSTCVVTGEAANGREALDIVRAGEVDVMVMDISMPDQSGVDALAAIKARAPDLPVLILSGFPEDALRHHACCARAPAGYLNKECDPEEIVQAIRTVARGRKYITPAVAELLADNLGGADKPPHELLSERELQVFLRLAKGETIGHMADSMSLSVKTVSTYRTRVMEKMKLSPTAT
jgi:two-component system invasion response regulator UvrY